MKRRMISLLCIVLGITMCLGLCLTGCGQTEEQATEGSTEPVTEAETLDEIDTALNRIGKVDWGGTDFCIVYSNDIGGYEEEIYAERLSGENSIINDAVYTRNKLLEEKCNLNLVLVGKNWSMVGTSMDTEAQTGTGEYQMFTMPCDQTTERATTGILFNYLSLDGVDYDAPWWDRGTVEFALDGRVFFLNGSWNIVDDEVTYVLMFNKKLLNDRQMDNPYDVVRGGDWTLDYFVNSLQGVAHDINGDGSMNDEDFYGLCGGLANTFFFGAGLRYIYNDRSMDMPELAMDTSMTERAVSALDKIRRLTKSKDYCEKGEKGHLTMFLEGRSLFFHECCSYVSAVNREMDGDFGVVPPPKYDKAQEHYYTYMHGIGSVFSMPANVKNADSIGGVIETMAVLSHRYLKPAYYDNMLTKRSVRDEDSAEILDMLLPNRVYDMGVYFSDLGFITVFSDSLTSSSNTFASSYLKGKKKYDKNMPRILATLQKQEQ